MLPTQDLKQNSSKSFVHEISIKVKGVPRTQSEVDGLCGYASYLLEKAKELHISGAGNEKVDRAFKKADQAQIGLYYLGAKMLGKGFVLDRETGFLTLSKKKEKDYKVGQTISFTDKTQTESVKITKIEIVKEKVMKDLRSYVKKNPSTLIPLFNVSEECQALQVRQKTSATQVQEKKTEAVYSTFLKEWQDKRIDPRIKEVKNINPNNVEGNIYIFGTHTSAPKGGVRDEYDKTNKGTPFHQRHQDWEKLGRTPKNDYLSIAYKHELVIPEDPKSPYRSVIHYLMLTIIEKCRQQTKSKPHIDKGKLQALDGLENNINKEPTPVLAYQYYQDFIQGKPQVLLELCIDLDNELKKALFHKFVGPDGKPTVEGQKLMATRTAKLYAGCEIGSPRIDAMVFKGYQNIEPKMFENDKLYAGFEFGYPIYGMVFGDQDSNTKNHSLYGANKVGKCLMQLRKWLRNQGETTNQIIDKPLETQPLALIKV